MVTLDIHFTLDSWVARSLYIRAFKCIACLAAIDQCTVIHPAPTGLGEKEQLSPPVRVHPCYLSDYCASRYSSIFSQSELAGLSSPAGSSLCSAMFSFFKTPLSKYAE